MVYRVGLFLAVGIGLLAPVFAVEKYPTREITLVVQSAPGGGSDFTSRTIAKAAEKYLGQKINVINKPGASGAIGMGFVANAKPDGYTIGYVPVELSLLKHQGYNNIAPDKFEMIMQAVSVPAALSVRADSPYQTIEDFIADAKEKPGKISVGNSGVGSIWHLGALSLEKEAQIQCKHIPFDGAAPALVAVMGGHVDAAVTGAAEALSHVQSGKLRLLGVLDKRRFSLLKKVPTMKERGLNAQIVAWGGFAAPKGTDPEIIKVLHSAFKKGFEEKWVKEAYQARGFGHAYRKGLDFTEFANEQSQFFEPLFARFGLRRK
ncbi:MAG: tripartite tricarboxylate transporter substrate binding protein [Deltaproteobacteria bacterium]|nr:tripartite tricarboxylate transporter substrate binding protein [Deltaproteobacteria bacterium]